MTLCVIPRLDNKVGAFCTSLGRSCLAVTPVSTLSRSSGSSLKTRTEGEVSILLASPHQRGPLEKNMSVPNDGHINYRLINPGKNSIGLFIEA